MNENIDLVEILKDAPKGTKVPKKHKEFKPFEKVLWVDHIQTKAWTAGFYSHYDELIKRHVLISGYIKRDYDILPYEGNEDKLGQIVK